MRPTNESPCGFGARVWFSGPKLPVHRLQRRVNSGSKTADFLRFYLLTPEGLQKLGDASPGGAGRNRTLGLKNLDAITVPPLDQQRWFDRLQRQVQQFEALRESAREDVEGLLPAMLDGVFSGRGTKT